MTKIDQILPGQIEGQQQKAKTAKGEGPSFQSFLDKAQAAEKAAPDGIQQVQESSLTAPVQQVGQMNAIAGQAQIAAVQQAEDLLSSMEQYAQMLGGNSTLKQMQGLVNQIREQAGQLQQAAGSLPEGDELSGLLEEVQAQAAVELMKFDRGEYNPA